MRDLRYLDLSFTNVSDISPLKKLTNLQELWLRATDVSDLSPLKDIKKLRTLWLIDTKVPKDDETAKTLEKHGAEIHFEE